LKVFTDIVFRVICGSILQSFMKQI